MKQLIPILNDMVIIFFDLLIFTRLISLKRDRLPDKILMYGGCAVIIAAYFLATYVFLLPASLSSALCMSIPSLLLFLYLSKHKDSRFFVTFCFVDSITLIIGFYGRYAGVLLHNRMFSDLLTLAVTAGLFLGVYLAGRRHFKRYHELLDIPNVGWRDMAIANALIYFGLLFFAAYPKPLIERVEYGPVYVVFSLISISFYTVFITSIQKTRRISEQNRLLEKEKEIFRIAYTDSLTGLANRAAYVERINAAAGEQIQNGKLFCIVFDLNNLKRINDSLGHQSGDLVLKAAARALKKVFSDEPRSLFRLGGDEFAVICREPSEAAVQEKLGALSEAAAQEQELLGLPLSLAAGFDYLRPDGRDTLEKVFARADERMYLNKKMQKECGDLSTLR